MHEAGALGVGVYARRRAVHPIGNGTVSIVVERVHVGAPHRAVGLYAVPVLPDGRCALGYRIEPRGIFAPQQKIVRRFFIAVVAERMEQVRRADKARLKVSHPLYQLIELFGGRRPVVGDIKIQREHAGGLRGVFYPAVLHIFPPERLRRFRRDILIFRNIPAERMSRLYK